MTKSVVNRVVAYFLVTMLIITGSISAGNFSFATTETGKGILFPLGGMTQWLGAFHTPGIEELTWCIDMGHTGIPQGNLAHRSTLPEQISDLGISEDLRVVSTTEAAWLLYQYQDIDETVSRAALAFIIHASFDKETASWGNLGGREKIQGTLAYLQNHHPQVIAKVREYVANARNYAVKMPLQLVHSYSGEETGTVTKIGVLNHAGNYVPGQKFALRLIGPAVFDSNGSDMIVGETASEPLSFNWRVTGNGEVKVRVRYENLPGRELSKLVQDANYQDMITTALVPSGKVTSLVSETGLVKVFYDFQPELKSQVLEAVSPGETATDIVDVYATKAGAGQWLKSRGKYIPIKWQVELHYLGEEMPAKNQMKSLKQVANFPYVTPGPGRYQVSAPIKEKGFYTWVWKMKRTDQGEQAKHVIADWQDPLGLEAETFVKPFTPRIRSQQNLISKRGGSDAKFFLNDWIEQSGFPADHPNFAGYGGIRSDRKEVNHYLYCVKSTGKNLNEANPDKKPKSGDRSIPVKELILDNTLNPDKTARPAEPESPNTDEKTLVWEGTTPARNGIFTIAALDNSPGLHVQALDCRGRLVFVSEFKGDDRVIPLRTDIDDPEESYIPDQPQITTQAYDAHTREKHLSFTPDNPQQVCIKDRIRYSELAAGEEYTLITRLGDKHTRTLIQEDGEEIKSVMRFTPKHRNGEIETQICAEKAKILGKQLVVFERLERKGKDPIIHEDWNDKDQSVYAPKLSTQAWTEGKGQQEFSPSLQDQIIYDELEVTGAMPQRDYWVKVGLKNPQGQELKGVKLLSLETLNTRAASPNAVNPGNNPSTPKDIKPGNNPSTNSGQNRDEEKNRIEEHHNPEEKIIRIHTNENGEARITLRASLSAQELSARYQDSNQSKWEQNILEKIKPTATPRKYIALQQYFVGKLSEQDLAKELDPDELEKILKTPYSSETKLPAYVTFTENIYTDENLVSLVYQHQELNNPKQQLKINPFPRIYTSAQAGEHNSKLLSNWDNDEKVAGRENSGTLADTNSREKEKTHSVKAKDTVTYQNLIPGEKYRLVASLQTQNGQKIAQNSKEFTPTHSNGSIEITIPLALEPYLGATLVVYEELYQINSIKDAKAEKAKLVAEHKDKQAHSQTLYIPLVRSRLLEANPGDNGDTDPISIASNNVPALTGRDNASVNNRVTASNQGENKNSNNKNSNNKELVLYDYLYYSGLEPGRSYSFNSQLVEAKTAQVIPLKNFQPLRFIADNTGKALVKYRVDEAQYHSGEAWVSTQELYEENPRGKRLLFRDYDLDNALQTYVRPVLAVTGFRSNLILAISLWSLGLGIIVVQGVGYHRNRDMKRKN